MLVLARIDKEKRDRNEVCSSRIPSVIFSIPFQFENIRKSLIGWFPVNTTASMKRLQADGMGLQDAPGY